MNAMCIWKFENKNQFLIFLIGLSPGHVTTKFKKLEMISHYAEFLIPKLKDKRKYSQDKSGWMSHCFLTIKHLFCLSLKTSLKTSMV